MFHIHYPEKSDGAHQLNDLANSAPCIGSHRLLSTLTEKFDTTRPGCGVHGECRSSTKQNPRMNRLLHFPDDVLQRINIRRWAFDRDDARIYRYQERGISAQRSLVRELPDAFCDV